MARDRSAVRTAQAGCLLLAAALLVAATAGAAPPKAERARQGRLRAALAVQRSHAARLMERPEVVGTGLGLDERGEPVIRVFTAGPAASADLPRELDGVPVRERVTGRFHALRGPSCESSGDGVCDTDERWPLPAPIGVSLGHPDITAGTAGARVTDGVQRFVLSNNHVIAAGNAATPGDPILQPGPYDGGSVAAGDEVAVLADFEPIAFCEIVFFVECPVPNVMDAAIALTTAGELGFATPLGEAGSVAGYGTPHVALHPAYGDPATTGDEDLVSLLGAAVRKHGRTTGDTTGTIDTVGVTSDVCYDEYCFEVARFVDQLLVLGPFSGPGDSGSLVVGDDAFHRPVGLLFAGGSNDSLLNRIDLVLARFGVSIDDGGTSPPITDAAVGSLATPSYGLLGQASSVAVTVRNAGTTALPPFDVRLDDATEATTSTETVPALAPLESVVVELAWTPTVEGSHALVVSSELADDVPSNDSVEASVPAFATAPGLSLRRWKGTAHTDTWTQVVLSHDYGDAMVPVCTPLYDTNGIGPLVARVRNAAGTSFEVGLGRPWFGAFPGEETSATVHCVIVREGVYDAPSFRLEAVRLEGFGAVDGAGAWSGVARAYAQAYASPVVLGQVVSSGGGPPGEIGVWSVFWARGATAFEPPGPDDLYVGRHTGEDPDARPPETLAYLVIEAGTGNLGGFPFEAGVGPETIRGMDDGPPFFYALGGGLARPTHGVLASAAMDGLEGGWPILYGVDDADALTSDLLGLSIEEDWYYDPERSHTTEQVAYLVLGARPPSCGLGPEVAVLLGLLRLARRRRGPRR